MTKGEYVSFRLFGDKTGFKRFVDYQHLDAMINREIKIHKMMYPNG